MASIVCFVYVSWRSVECEGPYMFTYANHNASVGSIGFRKNEHLVPSFCVQLTWGTITTPNDVYVLCLSLNKSHFHVLAFIFLSTSYIFFGRCFQCILSLHMQLFIIQAIYRNHHIISLTLFPSLPSFHTQQILYLM